MVKAVILACDQLPKIVRLNVDAISNVEPSGFDESYLDFLSVQIRLNARGEEWSDRLRFRKTNLSQYCNKPLIDARLRLVDHEFWFKVDPDTVQLIHWEQY